MRFSLVTCIAVAVGLARAEDSLVSRRWQKRGLDANGNYNISFLHVNDIHAHLDEFRPTGVDCVPDRECVGGYARIKTKVDEIRGGVNDSLLLNIGDEFQGTLFYTFYKGEKIAETINQLGFDAMTLGNHEFDGGDDELAAFIQNLTFPVVCANIQTNNTALNAAGIVPYHIFQNHSLAVIGVITPDTAGTSSAGPGTTFLDPVTVVQQQVDALRGQGIERIVTITHIGYEKDIELAKATRGVDLIIGGHSHTLIGNFTDAQGPYPTIANNLDGEEVFIVTSYRWGEYLGYIDVAFDPSGKIVSYNGGPIRMTNATAQNASLQAQIESWRGPFEAFAAEVVGQTTGVLDQTTCQQQECTLGNLIADSMIAYRLGQGGTSHGSIMNAGGIRASIPEGSITRGQVLTSFPFLNGVVDLTFTGEQLWQVFEGIVSDYSTASQHAVTSFVQVSSHIKFTYNPNAAVGSRLITLDIGGVPADMARTYTVTTIDFLATGGDFFWAPRRDFVPLDTLDEVLIDYLGQNRPYTPKLEGRIATTTETTPFKGGSGAGRAIANSAGSLFVGLTVLTALTLIL